MYIIAVLNQKGGCGKTSTCLHLGGALAEAGWRVLLVDLDPQASLTSALLGANAEAIPHDATVLEALEPEGRPLRDVIGTTSVDGIWLVPGSTSLAAYNGPCPQDDVEPDESGRLGVFLQDADADIDVALVDCPSGLSALAWSAIAASDGVIIPVVPDAMNVAAVIPVVGFINRVMDLSNPDVTVMGYLLSKVKARSTVHATYARQLRDFVQGGVFAAEVPEASAFGHAVESHRPVTLNDPRSAAASAMRAIAAEVSGRAGLRRLARKGVARG